MGVTGLWDDPDACAGCKAKSLALVALDEEVMAAEESVKRADAAAGLSARACRLARDELAVSEAACRKWQAVAEGFAAQLGVGVPTLDTAPPSPPLPLENCPGDDMPEPPPSKVVDLMDVLQKSLIAAKAGRPEPNRDGPEYAGCGGES